MSGCEAVNEVLEALKLNIAELEEKLNAKDSPRHEYEDLLKPIGIKGMEKPDKHDHHIAKFNSWFNKFRWNIINYFF